MEQQKTVSTMGQERQRLLRMLGWIHGQHLPQLVISLLIWHYGSNNGKITPGSSVFGVPVERIATFIVHYSPLKGGMNKEGVWPEERDEVIRLYGDAR